jgi:calcineurin-like phosphoesterase family protein
LIEISNRESHNFHFVADTHFSHEAILGYCNRPWVSIEDMNHHLIENWNKVVKPTDTVFHLGDVIFKVTEKEGNDILNKLNGNIVLIRGNHDRFIETYSKRFSAIIDYAELKIINGPSNYNIYCLMHYPIFSWNRQRHGSYMIHGHCHGTNNVNNQDCLRYDVGVDINGYTPVSLNNLSKIMLDKQLKLKES